MPEDSTIRPEHLSADEQLLQREALVMSQQQETSPEPQIAMQAAVQTAGAVQCPFCGTANEAEAVYCLSCGKPLRMGVCPNCGSEMDPEADFCEVCHHYVRTDVCSFCGAGLSGAEAYCPECGSPRGGIVCPTCHTLNDFAFCKQCGTPLTDEARQLLAEMKQQPVFQELMRAAREYESLQLQLPYSSERDMVRDQQNQKLRERVLTLLAKDRGESAADVKVEPVKRLTKDELDQQKERQLDLLTRLLESMALPPMPSPVKARNYAMAQKPLGVRLAWVCNFKNAMHSSPCGCAKPQMGGKWIMLGRNSKQEIKDDKS